MPLIRRPDGLPAPPPPAADPAAELRHGDTEARWSAARILGERPGSASLLGAALAGEPDARVREAIFTSLVRLGGTEAVEAAIPSLRSDDSGLRTGAMDVLRALIDAATPRLPALLADADSDVRVLACELARELAPAEATRLLCARLDHEPDANVCAAALDVLTEAGDASALPALERCAARFPDQRFLAFAVRVAVDRIASQSSDRDG